MFTWIIVILLSIIVISYIIRRYEEFSIIHSRWQCHFADMQFSSEEFYQMVEEIIKKKQVPHVSFERREYLEGSIISDKRIYLRVKQKEHLFLICAAPYGTGFFVSWWLGETTTFLKDLCFRIPFIGPYIERISSSKTYFQMDTENMFLHSIKSCVLEAVDSITKAKGIRQLSEFERQPTSSIK